MYMYHTLRLHSTVTNCLSTCGSISNYHLGNDNGPIAILRFWSSKNASGFETESYRQKLPEYFRTCIDAFTGSYFFPANDDGEAIAEWVFTNGKGFFFWETPEMSHVWLPDNSKPLDIWKLWHWRSTHSITIESSLRFARELTEHMTTFQKPWHYDRSDKENQDGNLSDLMLDAMTRRDSVIAIKRRWSTKGITLDRSGSFLSQLPAWFTTKKDSVQGGYWFPNDEIGEARARDVFGKGGFNWWETPLTFNAWSEHACTHLKSDDVLRMCVEETSKWILGELPDGVPVSDHEEETVLDCLDDWKELDSREEVLVSGKPEDETVLDESDDAWETGSDEGEDKWVTEESSDECQEKDDSDDDWIPNRVQKRLPDKMGRGPKRPRI